MNHNQNRYTRQPLLIPIQKDYKYLIEIHKLEEALSGENIYVYGPLQFD